LMTDFITWSTTSTAITSSTTQTRDSWRKTYVVHHRWEQQNAM